MISTCWYYVLYLGQVLLYKAMNPRRFSIQISETPPAPDKCPLSCPLPTTPLTNHLFVAMVLFYFSSEIQFSAIFMKAGFPKPSSQHFHTTTVIRVLSLPLKNDWPHSVSLNSISLALMQKRYLLLYL